MNQLSELARLKEKILSGSACLFLGAGASADSTNRTGDPIPLSGQFSQQLTAHMGLQYDNEPLRDVFRVAKARFSGSQINEILQNSFRHCRPCNGLKTIAKHPWRRIYTTNIDDSLESAIREAGVQNLEIFGIRSSIQDPDILFSQIQYIKLNGSVDSLHEGVIFAPEEYANASIARHRWYDELVQDYHRYAFIFIGSRLDEPLFDNALARFQNETHERQPLSYVFVPHASEIYQEGLKARNLFLTRWNLSQFADWLVREINTPPSSIDVARNARPELRAFENTSRISDQKALTFVKAVDPALMALSEPSSSRPGSIRDFYRGFKPTWRDILDEVPAHLQSHKQFLSAFSTIWQNNRASGKIFLITGPAGSGKTTLLMSSALNAFRGLSVRSYFLDSIPDDFVALIETLESYNSNPYALFIDRIDRVREPLQESLERGILVKGIVVGCESARIWDIRTAGTLTSFVVQHMKIDKIDVSDVVSILEKIEKFGPWTRLSKMRPEQRKDEIFKNAHRQLLIAMLSATRGIGFEKIIQTDYEQIEDYAQRKLVVLAGLATYHHSDLPSRLADRALRALNVFETADELSSRLSGVVRISNGNVSVRHPVYVRQLFEQVVSKDLLLEGLLGLTDAFAVYGSPVARFVKRSEGFLFKSIMNHRFLKDLFKDDFSFIIRYYENYETIFSQDGLYWLQYGLALRDAKQQRRAYEKLAAAVDAFASRHTQHALAQQILILALEENEVRTAESMFDKAYAILDSLRSDQTANDYYPLVTLAEGHINFLIKIGTREGIADLVVRYEREVRSELRKRPNEERLSQCHRRLLMFGSTGEWDATSLVDGIDIS